MTVFVRRLQFILWICRFRNASSDVSFLFIKGLATIMRGNSDSNTISSEIHLAKAVCLHSRVKSIQVA